MVFMVEALQICRWACYLIKERKNEAKMSKKSLLFSSLLPSDELCFIDAWCRIFTETFIFFFVLIMIHTICKEQGKYFTQLVFIETRS